MSQSTPGARARGTKAAQFRGAETFVPSNLRRTLYPQRGFSSERQYSVLDLAGITRLVLMAAPRGRGSFQV
jgi:hypothetical protein